MRAWLRPGVIAALVIQMSQAGCVGPLLPPQSPATPAPAAVSSPALPVQLLATAIADRKLVLLGELHGTRETPALLGDLVEHYARAGREVILALEITSRDQDVVDRYLASTGSASDRSALLSGEHWRKPMHDGRDSQAMLALVEHLRRLRADGRDVAIFLFDPGGGEHRNQGMADNLRSLAIRHPRALVLVLTGNVHAMTRAPTWEMFDAGRRIDPPMTAGRYLSDLQPLSINIEAASGTIWTCMDGICDMHALPARAALPRPVLQAAESADYAWDATLTLPKFTASLPAVP